jgi:hypothetical protein
METRRDEGRGTPPGSKGLSQAPELGVMLFVPLAVSLFLSARKKLGKSWHL